MVKRIFALLITLLLIGSMAVTAFADHPVPDLTQNGSITFVMDWDGQLLDSGSLNLYKVGEIVENDGNDNIHHRDGHLMRAYATEISIQWHLERLCHSLRHRQRHR